MNYGLSLMARGQYNETLPYFKRTMELMPNWAFIHINMGVLRDAMGFPEEAEQYFKNAIQLQPTLPDAYYFYARWLAEKGKIDEAIEQLQTSVKMGSVHVPTNELLNALLVEKSETKEDKIKKAEKYIQENPSANNYLDLSLLYYKNGQMKECISACEKALELQPRMAMAYNNICAAYNSLGEWKKGISACKKAIEIDTSFQLAKNNLAWAQNSLKK